ncbi:hypothetical protein Ciccas_010563 [Cichlidogyrus casuarinus]|uniref:GATA-type domain-containing protein n=1 Tax=Cichlidogyrus casuarinus TaxID=1844966 RepID=A0ABD2PTV9_9PLAT
MVFYCSSCNQLTESTGANYHTLLCDTCTNRHFFTPYTWDSSSLENEQPVNLSFLDELLATPPSTKETPDLFSIYHNLESSTQYLSDQYSHLLCTPPTPDELKRPSRKRIKKNEDMQCHNCHTRYTSLWRRDTQGFPICNACGLYYKMHKTHRPSNLQRIDSQPRRRRNSSEVLQPINYNKQFQPDFSVSTPNLVQLLNLPTNDVSDKFPPDTPKKLSPPNTIYPKRSLFSF